MTGEQIIDNLITDKKATCYIRNSEILIEMKKGELLKLINGILEDLLDDESLKDESNGRYNREMELRDKIAKKYK